MGAIFRELGDRTRELGAHGILLSAKLALGEADESLRMAKDMADLCMDAGQWTCHVDALKKVASVHCARKEPQEAREAAEDARRVCQQLGEVEREVSMLEVVIESRVMEKEIDRAVDAMEEIAAVYRKQGWQRREAANYREIATFLLKRGMPTRALQVAE